MIWATFPFAVAQQACYNCIYVASNLNYILINIIHKENQNGDLRNIKRRVLLHTERERVKEERNVVDRKRGVNKGEEF